nr:ASCH domain-containing protein [uncultured Enterobacter sp.]
MSKKISALKETYPQAHIWEFGDSAQMADELSTLVIEGHKTATCCSYHDYLAQDKKVLVGDYHIVLNGLGYPACVLRTLSLSLVRFNDITADQAALEGEGDKSLAHWRAEHQAFFTREGTFADDMELVFEQFAVVEIC